MIRWFALISGIQPQGTAREGENERKEWKELCTVLPMTISDDLGNALGLRVSSDTSFLRRSLQSCDRVTSQGYATAFKYIRIDGRHRAYNKAWVRNR